MQAPDGRRASGAVPRRAWLLRAVPTVALAVVVLWAVAAARAEPAGAQQVPAQQQGSRLPPEVRLLPNDQLGRMLATERNPLVRDAIVTELKGRGEMFFENRPSSPFAGGKVDIPLGRWGLTFQGGVNDHGGVAIGGGGYAGLPGAPSIGKVTPRPDGFNVQGEVTVSLGKDTSVTAKGTFNVSPDGQISGTAGGKVEIKGLDGRSFSVGANVEFKDGQVTVTTENGTKLASGNGSSVSLDPATVDDKGNFETKGSINLPSKQQGEQGPWGERVPSITMKGTITLDKKYDTFTEFLQGIGVLDKPGPPTQEEFQKALDGWAESMRQRREQAEKAEQQRQQELEQLQKQQQEQQQQQNQQPEDQQQQQAPDQSQQQPADQNQQPGQEEQQAPTAIVPDGNQQTAPGSDGSGQAPPTPPAAEQAPPADGQTPTAPSTGAPEVANSGTDGSTVAGNATGAMASELAGTDYTGAYDSGGTADYSGGYATDFGAGDASCACF